MANTIITRCVGQCTLQMLLLWIGEIRIYLLIAHTTEEEEGRLNDTAAIRDNTVYYYE